MPKLGEGMQVEKSSIRVGSKYVAEVWVDGGAVRAEGGPARPELILPLSIQMGTQPEESQLGIAWLRASLSFSDNPTPEQKLSRATDEVLVGNHLITSPLTSGHDQQVLLRFPLTADEVERLEWSRHASDADTFALHLSLQTVVVAVATVINDHSNIDQRWDSNLGMLAQLLPFWHSSVDPVRVTMSQSHWIRNVLPGLGHDHRRLIEVAFPPSLPDHGRAAKEWDKARTALDAGRYDECIGLCRSQLKGWSKQLGGGKQQTVAQAIAARHGWLEGDARAPFIDSIWTAALNLANSESHPEGSSAEQDYRAADARLMLIVTAALSEYVHEQTGSNR